MYFPALIYLGWSAGSIEPSQGGPRQTGKTFFQRHAVPDVARLYDRHAEDCVRTAQKIDNPNHRSMLLKTAAEWRQALVYCTGAR
jgi:hypothetical protein